MTGPKAPNAAARAGARKRAVITPQGLGVPAKGSGLSAPGHIVLLVAQVVVHLRLQCGSRTFFVSRFNSLSPAPDGGTVWFANPPMRRKCATGYA